MPRRVASCSLVVILAALGSGCNETPQAPRRASSGPGLKFVGFDANPTLTEALGQGKIQGLVLQDPFQMGDMGVRTMVVHLEQGEVKPRIGTGEKMATPENMKSAVIDKLLHPPKETGSTDPGKLGAKTKKWRVLVIPKATANEFWQTVHAGALSAAKELDNVEVVWKGPEKEDDYNTQIELIESAKKDSVDGIVLAPVDSKVLVSPVEQAIDRGIPVVIIDSDLESMRTVSFVATDNYHGGVLAAKRMADLLGEKGNVVLMKHMVGSMSTEQREKGFLETIARYQDIKVLSQNQYAGPTVETAQHAAQELIKMYQGQVDGIFCSNEQSTEGMFKALDQAGMLKTKPGSTQTADARGQSGGPK